MPNSALYAAKGRLRRICSFAVAAAASVASGLPLHAQEAPPPRPQTGAVEPRAAQPATRPATQPSPRGERPGVFLIPGGPFGPGGPDGPPPFDGPPGGPGGFGGPGGPNRAQTMLVKQFDKDGNGWLNAEERKPARDAAKAQRTGPGGRGGPRFGPGGRGGPGGENQQPKPGAAVSPADARAYPAAPLYETSIVRTFFLEFENKDWETELSDFYNTDVEVPATLVVDGRRYPNVGVSFRGASSYFTVGQGLKRSMKLTMDLADKKQDLHGYKTLNLLNSHTDPSYLHTVLYLQVARNYLPAAKANYVKLAMNGEGWGIYVNTQQVNGDFLDEWYPSSKGTRWKAPGSPRGGAGLTWLGEQVEPYKTRFEIKSKDDPDAWKALIELCRVLNQTPPEKLEEALKPILDIDGALWFLAVENVFINNDGYWIRTSDYNLFRDKNGIFHIIPHDTNETFQSAGGPGMQRGDRISGVELPPLQGAQDREKPLLSKLLAVPALRKRYLHHVRVLADEWLDWDKLGPIARMHQSLIEKEVELDTHKLYAFNAFKGSLEGAAGVGGGMGRGNAMSIRAFAEQRRKYLLNHPDLAKPAQARAEQPTQ